MNGLVDSGFQNITIWGGRVEEGEWGNFINISILIKKN